jgi:hypothetical protein
MCIYKASAVDKKPRGTQTRSQHKPVMTVAAMVALVTAVTFAGAPAAIAAPTFTNNHSAYAVDGQDDGCTGNCSWPCSLPCRNCSCGGGGA